MELLEALLNVLRMVLLDDLLVVLGRRAVVAAGLAIRGRHQMRHAKLLRQLVERDAPVAIRVHLHPEPLEGGHLRLELQHWSEDNGLRLHKDHGPDYWCVTFEDLEAARAPGPGVGS